MSPLRTPACDLLGCRYPVVLAGMGGVARSELVAAVTVAGGFGFLGMVRESAALIREEVRLLRRLGHQRFGVNLIPAATAPALLEAEIAACIDLQVPVVCLFWDIDPGLVRRLRDAGILVVYQIGSLDEARAAEAAGAGLIIAQGVEAGGHVRGTRPLRLLLPEIAAAIGVPVLAAGGIATGADLAVALALGAQGVVVGTAMIPTAESFAHDFHKEQLLAAGSGDTVLTQIFHINWPPGASVRVLASDVTRGRRGDPKAQTSTVIGWEDGRPIHLFSTDSPLRSTTGDFAAMPLYAGMGVGRLGEMTPAGQRLSAMMSEAERLLAAPPDAIVEMPEASSPVCYAAEADPEYMGYLSRGALAEALLGLRDLARAALLDPRLATTAGLPGAPEALRLARWAVQLDQCGTRLGGAGQRPETADKPEAAPLALLRDTARQLLPKASEDDVRAMLAALLRELGGEAGIVPWSGGPISG